MWRWCHDAGVLCEGDVMMQACYVKVMSWCRCVMWCHDADVLCDVMMQACYVKVMSWCRCVMWCHDAGVLCDVMMQAFYVMSWCRRVMWRWCHNGGVFRGGDVMMWECSGAVMSWCGRVLGWWCHDVGVFWGGDVTMWACPGAVMAGHYMKEMWRSSGTPYRCLFCSNSSESARMYLPWRTSMSSLLGDGVWTTGIGSPTREGGKERDKGEERMRERKKAKMKDMLDVLWLYI